MATMMQDLSESFNKLFISGVKTEMKHKINALADEFRKKFEEQVEALALAAANDVAIEILTVVELSDPRIRYKVLIEVLKKGEHEKK